MFIVKEHWFYCMNTEIGQVSFQNVIEIYKFMQIKDVDCCLDNVVLQSNLSSLTLEKEWVSDCCLDNVVLQSNLSSLTLVKEWVSDCCLDNVVLQSNSSSLTLEKEWVSDCCLKPNEQFFSHIMARTNYISVRCWWCLFCTRPTHLVGF
jgi:hypothetical protein